MKNLTLLPRILVCLVLATVLGGCAASTGASTSSASAKKSEKKAYNPVGNWQYTVQTPNGDSYGVMVVSGGNGVYEATLQTDQFGDLVVKDFAVVGTGFTGNIEVMGTTADLAGTFEGEKMSGSVTMGMDSFPLQGTRKAK